MRNLPLKGGGDSEAWRGGILFKSSQAKGPKKPWGLQMSVILRKKNGRCRPVSFRDYPELRAVSVVVDRKDSKLFPERELVFGSVLFSDISPIPLDVPRKSEFHILWMEGILSIGSYDCLP